MSFLLRKKNQITASVQKGELECQSNPLVPFLQNSEKH